MANYANLKAALDAAIKTNTTKDITGNGLNSALDSIIDELGAGYQYMGAATTSGNPGTPDYNVFYLATASGTYTNYGGIVLASGEIAILKYNGSWSKDTILTVTSSITSGSGSPVTSGAVYTAIGNIETLLAAI